MADHYKPPKRRTHNHLCSETSPYLLQHQYNPVNWHPWGPLALRMSTDEKKPIFLSIGYSACHWCHVMEHESFENTAIADLLNEHFISIKVDREERPDLDQIYMSAVQLLTGRGGWPMSVFLTPQLKPFYGGTYFPPTDRAGLPGFQRILETLIQEWKQRPEEIQTHAQQLTTHIRNTASVPSSATALSEKMLDDAFLIQNKQFDDTFGGFGQAPKFPHSLDLRLLLRTWYRTGNPRPRQMAEHTLTHMSNGGIFDQLGGGFHRYSVDNRWLVPHFEKMLYDNALLIPCYLETFQLTGNSDYAETSRKTLDYVLSSMTHPDGGFYSTEDADSEGKEGTFYTWNVSEITTILGKRRAELFCSCYDVSKQGNWEGTSILNRPKTIAENAAWLGLSEKDLLHELKECSQLLLNKRNSRIRPDRDEKILTDWNALMIDACICGYRVLQDKRYLDAAVQAISFLLDNVRTPEGMLLHCYKNETAKFPAYADDYAYLIHALIQLYEATFDWKWIDTASQLAELFIEHFWDPEEYGFFFTGKNHETLITRPKIGRDNVTPSANGVAAFCFQRLSQLTANPRYALLTEQILNRYQSSIIDYPQICPQLLLALDEYLAPSRELVITAPDNSKDLKLLCQKINSLFLPNTVVAVLSEKHRRDHPLFQGKDIPDNQIALYLCQNNSCEVPVIGLSPALDKIRSLIPPHARNRNVENE